MRVRSREVAVLGPVAERSRHPAQITVVCEWFQQHRGEFSKHSNRPRMSRCLCEPLCSSPRLLDLARPFERMLAGAFFPAQMEQDSWNIDFHLTNIFARAAQRRRKRQVSRGAAVKI